jgi:hypothetical protein
LLAVPSFLVFVFGHFDRRPIVNYARNGRVAAFKSLAGFLYGEIDLALHRNKRMIGPLGQLFFAISTATREEIVLFTLAESPLFRETKKDNACESVNPSNRGRISPHFSERSILLVAIAWWLSYRDVVRWQVSLA